jgi:hypothetical protein
VRLELITNCCFPNKDADEDNEDVFWGIVEENEEDASESQVVSGETQIKREKRCLKILISFNLFRA